MSDPARMAAAHDARKRYAAERAVEDPARLDRAVRVVRAALQKGRLSFRDVLSVGPDAPVELRSAVDSAPHAEARGAER